jgi:uncharacterized protein (TIGR00251 family)
MPNPPWLRMEGEAALIDVHVQPGARRDEIVGEYGGRLKIAIVAPPLDGRANAALVDVLARRLGLPRSAVRLVAGASGRAKRLRVDTGGLAAAEVVNLLVGGGNEKSRR